MPNVEEKKVNLTEFVARQNLFIEQVNHKQMVPPSLPCWVDLALTCIAATREAFAKDGCKGSQ